MFELSLIQLIDGAVILSFLIALRTIQGYQRRRGLPYPPGPPGLPLIGNTLDIPSKFPWLAFTEYAKKYGYITSYRFFRRDIIVLSDINAIKELFEKRGSVYSDRFDMPFLEMMEWQWQIPIARYGEAWRQGRKLLDRSLRPGAAAMYRPMQQTRARVLLTRLLATPDEWRDHIELFQGGLILDMTYGYEAKGKQDRKLVAPKLLTEFSGKHVYKSAWILNGFPFLRHIPAWVPYFSFKPLAEMGRALSQEMLYPPMRFVKESINN
jgi:hypothetical protein